MVQPASSADATVFINMLQFLGRLVAQRPVCITPSTLAVCYESVRNVAVGLMTKIYNAFAEKYSLPAYGDYDGPYFLAKTERLLFELLHFSYHVCTSVQKMQLQALVVSQHFVNVLVLCSQLPFPGVTLDADCTCMSGTATSSKSCALYTSNLAGDAPKNSISSSIQNSSLECLSVIFTRLPYYADILGLEKVKWIQHNLVLLANELGAAVQPSTSTSDEATKHLLDATLSAVIDCLAFIAPPKYHSPDIWWSDQWLVGESGNFSWLVRLYNDPRYQIKCAEIIALLVLIPQSHYQLFKDMPQLLDTVLDHIQSLGQTGLAAKVPPVEIRLLNHLLLAYQDTVTRIRFCRVLDEARQPSQILQKLKNEHSWSSGSYSAAFSRRLDASVLTNAFSKYDTVKSILKKACILPCDPRSLQNILFIILQIDMHPLPGASGHQRVL